MRTAGGCDAICPSRLEGKPQSKIAFAPCEVVCVETGTEVWWSLLYEGCPCMGCAPKHATGRMGI